jgi:hypothetical protein
MPSLKKVTTKTFHQSCRSFVSSSPLTLVDPKKIFFVVHKLWTACFPKPCIHFLIQITRNQTQAPTLFPFMHIGPISCEQQTHPLFNVPSPYTSTVCLWISTKWTFLAFKNGITNCITQGMGFFIFRCIFNHSKQEKNLWHHSMQCMFCLSHRWWLTFRGSAHVTCTAATHEWFSYFLDVLRTYYAFSYHHIITGGQDSSVSIVTH